MIVLDSSAAIAIAQNTDEGRAFKRLFLRDEDIIAPDFFEVEAANVAWKYVHAGIYSAEEGIWLLKTALSLVDCFVPAESMLVEVTTCAIHVGHSVYDMLYLVLARRNGATLATCDKGLQKLCQFQGVDCIVEAEC